MKFILMYKMFMHSNVIISNILKLYSSCTKLSINQIFHSFLMLSFSLILLQNFKSV